MTMQRQSRCEQCGKWVRNYWSLPNCNETGRGVCLCKTCHDGLTCRKDDHAD